jgi:parvulin-like peptidyl-prolyl isomerase
MRLRYLSILAPLGALAFAGCGGDSGGVPSNAVAVVESCDASVTKNDFNQVLDQAKTNYEKNKQKFPGPGTQEYRAVQDQIVNYLVLREGYICEGKDMGIEVTDEEIDKRLDELVQQYYKGDKKKFEEALKEQGVSEPQLRRELTMQIYQKKIFDQVTGDVKVTDEEIREYYTKNKSQYETPATRTVRHILVKKKALASTIEQQLRSGASFEQLVKQYSQDPGSKKTGGKLTDLAQGQTVPPFDKVAFSIKTNAISEPVKTQFGFHIIQALTAVKPADTSTLAEVRDQVREVVSQTKKTEAGQKWSEDFREDLQSANAVSYQTGYQPPTTSTTTSAG